jgi:hypothetical protein
MTDEELAAFRSYPRSKLIAFISGDIPTSPRHIAARFELDRRAGAFGRRLAAAAFAISVLSLIVSWLSYTAAHRSHVVAPSATPSLQPR